MSNLTFIHAADVHLGRPFSGLDRTSPDLGSLFRRAGWEAWNRVVTTAVERKVDFVALAGDVFDSWSPSIRAQLTFREGVDRLHQARIPVFMTLGNHDPLATFPDSLSRLPGLHLFGTDPEGLTPECTEFIEGVRIYGASFERSSVRENLAANFRRDPGVQVAVGILHTNVSGMQGHENYAPCSLNDLKAAGMDVWCLGHVHTPAMLSRQPLILYSGATQGARIQESGPRGAYLVSLDDRCCASAEFLPLAPVWWLTVGLDASRLDTFDDLLRAAEESLSEVPAVEHPPEALVARIDVTAAGDLLSAVLMSEDESMELLIERLSLLPAPVFLESVNVTTAHSKGIEALMNDRGLVGEFLRECSVAAADPSRLSEISEEVFRELLSHVSHSYLAEELRADGSSHEIWSRLLEEAAAEGGRMFLEDESGAGARHIAIPANEHGSC